MATDPAFAATPKIGLAQVTAANTNRDGTGTVVDVLTGGASGTKVERVKIVAAGTTTAGVVRLYLYDGTNTRLLSETLVTAVTPSTSVAVFSSEVVYYDMVLPSSTWKLRASTHNAETFNIVALGADL